MGSRGRWEEKPREAAGKRGRAAPAPAQVHACAMHGAAPRPPQSGPGPPGPRCMRTCYPAVVLLKSLSPRFRKSGSIQDGHFFFLVNIASRRAQRGIAPPLTWVCLLTKNIQLSFSEFYDKMRIKSL